MTIRDPEAICFRIRDSFDKNDLEEAAGAAIRAMELQAYLESAGGVPVSNCVRGIGRKIVANRVIPSCR